MTSLFRLHLLRRPHIRAQRGRRFENSQLLQSSKRGHQRPEASSPKAEDQDIQDLQVSNSVESLRVHLHRPRSQPERERGRRVPEKGLRTEALGRGRCDVGARKV